MSRMIMIVLALCLSTGAYAQEKSFGEWAAERDAVRGYTGMEETQMEREVYNEFRRNAFRELITDHLVSKDPNGVNVAFSQTATCTLFYEAQRDYARKNGRDGSGYDNDRTAMVNYFIYTGEAIENHFEVEEGFAQNSIKHYNEGHAKAYTNILSVVDGTAENAAKLFGEWDTGCQGVADKYNGFWKESGNHVNRDAVTVERDKRLQALVASRRGTE